MTRIVNQEAHLLWATPNAQQVIERAARTCYKSEDKIGEGTAGKMIRMLVEKGHEAMLEHASASFLCVTDRGVSHEIVRHRLASYAQESTRYCNYGKGGQIVLSPMLEGLTPLQLARRQVLYDRCEEVYLAEVAEGVKPQQARDNLPTCLKTEIVWTANLREWRHILKLRTAPAAHPRMRELVGMISEYLTVMAPDVFAEFAS